MRNGLKWFWIWSFFSGSARSAIIPCIAILFHIYTYIYNKDGELGGYGINIEYSFVTTDINLSSKQDKFRLDQSCSMDVPTVRNNTRYINRGDSKMPEILQPTEEQKNNLYIPNYADPYIAANYRGY